MGQPQYLCLEIPQSFKSKVNFFFTNSFFSKYFIASIIDSSGTLRLSKNSEL